MRAKISPIETINNDSDSDSSDDQSPRTIKGKEGTAESKVDCSTGDHGKRRQELRDRVVKEILSAVLPDIGAYEIDGMAPRQIAKKGQFYEILKFLGLWPLTLHESIMNGSMYHFDKATREIMIGKKANPLLVNSYDEQGRTALSLAVKAKRMDMIVDLLGNNALPDIYDEINGRTPLMYSILNGTHAISKLLIQHGADERMSDFKCMTPLMVATSKNDVIHCQILLNKIIDIDSQDENGWTALHHAAQHNAAACCALLISEGADRNIKDMNKRKPIHIAKFKNYGDSISALEDLKSRLAFAVGDFD